MSLSQQQKQSIVVTIDKFFQGSISTTVDEITEEVAEIITTMAKEIDKCVKSMKLIQTSLENALKLSPESVLKHIKFIFDNMDKDVQAKACINRTVLYYKSPLYIALMGI